ncbi:Zinc finger BED domain-containing protein DAYSLEEPER [Euphorbia peplus]|nr:Zinc finger BED domain-containing protein DAYSLEEPER [Euphorbia peplus]
MSHSQQEKDFKVPASSSADDEATCNGCKCLTNNKGLNSSEETPLRASAEDKANCKEGKPNLIMTSIQVPLGTGDSEDARVEELKKGLAVFILHSGLQFEMVENEAFNMFILSQFRPKLEIPSAQSFIQYCYKLYLDEKLKLQKFLATNCQSVCLTSDAWTSVQGRNYLGITAHFIDEDWKLQRKILHFVANRLSSGEEISTEIETCLLDWGINKVFTITMDTMSSNNNAIVYLKEKLIKQGNGLLDCKYLQMKCIAQIINSVVVEALEEANLSVNRVRDAVRYVKVIPGKLKKFKKCVEDEKTESADILYLDESNVWSTTYVMLCRAEKYEKAFVRYQKLDPHFKDDMDDGLPSSADWSVVRQLTVILRPFYNIMLNISRSSNVTSNNFWVDMSDLYAVFLEWKNGDNPKLKSLADKMKLKLEDYFGGYVKMNKIVYIASILDPRLKLEVLEFAFCRIFGEEKGTVLFKDVKEALFELFNEYKKSTLQLKDVDKSNTASNEASNEDIAYKNFFMISYKKQKIGSEDKKSELESYLDEPTQDDTADFDILEWWNNDSSRFPILARMARDILAIPKSTVRPDLTFNTNGNVLDKYRGNMDSEILQVSVCVREWLRTWPFQSQAYIVKEHDEDEMVEEELVEESGEVGPSLVEESDNE